MRKIDEAIKVVKELIISEYPPNFTIYLKEENRESMTFEEALDIITGSNKEVLK